MSVFIIAEAGVNHNGDLSTAKKLVDAAAEAGADAIKYQTFKAEKVAAFKEDPNQVGMLKKLELSESDFADLFTYCSEKHIQCMSTAFDESSVDFLDSLGMEIFKIPSGEITNKYLIQRVASKKKPILLSTGMSFLGEVETAISWIFEIWSPLEEKPRLTLLHCVSKYPAKSEDVNLKAMETLKRSFQLPVGFSDHTLGIEVPIAAVALGAEVIEKHFTLDRNMEGPDHKSSLEPKEFREMVRGIRNVERALGDGIKRPAPNEEKTKGVARRSLVAARKIKAGDIISEDDIALKRPGTGIQPEFKEILIGMKVRRDIGEDTVFRWDDVKDA